MQHSGLSTLSKAGYLSALHSLSEIPPSSLLASLFCRNCTVHKHCELSESNPGNRNLEHE